MKNITYKYNRFLITLLAVSPFVSYLMEEGLNISFKRTFQLLSFIGILLIFIFKDKKRPIIIPKYLFFYFLFILYVYYSAFIQLERDFKIDYLFSNNLITALNMIFIIENFPISKKYYRDIFRLSKYILMIAFLVIIYQAIIDDSFYMIPMDMEAQSSFLETKFNIRLKSIYSYLGYLTFGLGFLPIMIWVVESLDKKKKSVLIWIFMALIYAFLSKARWLMINTLLVFVVLIINSNKNKIMKSFKYSFIFLFIVITSSIALSSIGINTNKIIEDRILESKESKLSNTSAGTRILAFKAFDILFWDHPLFGVGNIKYGMGGVGKNDYKLRSILRGHSSQIHVGYLKVLYMYGLIGASFFFLFLYFLLKKFYKTARITGIWAPFLSILIFVFVNFVQVTFTFSEMGLLLIIFVNRYNSQEIVVRK